MFTIRLGYSVLHHGDVQPRAEITMLLLFRGVATSQQSEELRMNQGCIYLDHFTWGGRG